MTVREIVTEYLKAGGFDGLAYESCGCGLDDLMPCESYKLDCKPARKVVCKDDGFSWCGGCDYGCNAVEREVASVYVAE